MNRQDGGGLRAALGWMAFPLVPVVLENLYHDTVNLSYSTQGGPDPHDWDWVKWVTLVGPLAGYGFLSGATIGLSDDPDRTGWRRWLGRRSVWVAVGPWLGFLAWSAAYFALRGVDSFLSERAREAIDRRLGAGQGTWTRWAVGWVLIVCLVVTLCYAWLLPAGAALRRARRVGALSQAFQRGLGMAVVFVGSLFGSFWAITAGWRSFFFDSRIVPVGLAALSLAALSGCSGPITYGEVRRRELFHALLMAWVLGLALLWRWWGRPRRQG